MTTCDDLLRACAANGTHAPRPGREICARYVCPAYTRTVGPRGARRLFCLQNRAIATPRPRRVVPVPYPAGRQEVAGRRQIGEYGMDARRGPPGTARRF